jgi:hypothetical protein
VSILDILHGVFGILFIATISVALCVASTDCRQDQSFRTVCVLMLIAWSFYIGMRWARSKK